MRLRNAALATFIACAPATALAQQKQEPRRPVLIAGADTNDAHAYYGFAIERLTKEPQKAADALYWATRLDPNWADAFYARWVAMMLTDVTRYQLYSSGDRRTVAEVRAIDSLLFRALTLNPFVPRRLERKLFDATLDAIALRAARGQTSSGNVRFEMELAMQKWPPWRRARFAHGDGQFEQALGLYSIAIEKDQKDFGLRLDRGRLLFEMGRFEGALLDLQSAMEDIKKQQEKDLVFFYRSRAVTEHSIAVVHQKLGNTAAAKEAFGRALEQDLAYYPAHLQLANIALDAKDTTAALAELALATQLRP
ncbi:MAG TPA: tetratricopeptide repeat protein, partial [Gemmatimonadaceae bacterium]